ncbi:MAG: hypothetical protein ABSG79_27205, partial [Bryobacteraceae bacterium]
DIAHEDGGYRPHVRVNVLGDGLQLAGFQMTLTGRFWVTPEDIPSTFSSNYFLYIKIRDS